MLRIDGFKRQLENQLTKHVKDKKQLDDPKMGVNIDYNLSNINCTYSYKSQSEITLKKEILSSYALESYVNNNKKMSVDSSVKTTTTNTQTYVKTTTTTNERAFNIGLNLAYQGVGLGLGYTRSRGTTVSTENSASTSSSVEKSKNINIELDAGEETTLIAEDCLIDVRTCYNLYYHFSGTLSYTTYVPAYQDVKGFCQHAPNYVHQAIVSTPYMRIKQTDSVKLYDLFKLIIEKSPFELLEQDDKNTLVLKVPVKIHNISRLWQYHAYKTQVEQDNAQPFFLSKPVINNEEEKENRDLNINQNQSQSTARHKEISNLYKFRFFSDIQKASTDVKVLLNKHDADHKPSSSYLTLTESENLKKLNQNQEEHVFEIRLPKP